RFGDEGEVSNGDVARQGSRENLRRLGRRRLGQGFLDERLVLLLLDGLLGIVGLRLLLLQLLLGGALGRQDGAVLRLLGGRVVARHVAALAALQREYAAVVLDLDGAVGADDLDGVGVLDRVFSAPNADGADIGAQAVVVAVGTAEE